MVERLPDFLLVGAQKCGTTTMYFDLLSSPDVFFPVDKEPGNLADDAVLLPAGRRRYATLYGDSAPHQRCGDASTAYTMGDHSHATAHRARRVLGLGTTVLYLVRDPVDRIRSHYRHQWTLERETRPIDVAVRKDPQYVTNSSYARQLRPWRDLFGDNVHVLQFERFVEDRPAAAARVANLLGISSYAHLVDAGTVHNASTERLLMGPAWRRVQESTAYQAWIRARLTPAVRARVRRLLLPAAPQPPDDTLDEPTLVHLVDALVDDLAQHAAILGMAPWSPETLLAAHATPTSEGGRPD